MRSWVLGLSLIVLALVGFWFFRSRPTALPLWTPPEHRATAILGNREFFLDIADTLALREQGLSGRAGLPENGGMIFLFDEPSPAAFWMKGMLFPIDIFWIRDNTIIAIKEQAEPPAPGTPPEALPRFIPPQPADIVIETRAGMARDLGIQTGQEVHILLP